jgi:protein ImuB
MDWCFGASGRNENATPAKALILDMSKTGKSKTSSDQSAEIQRILDILHKWGIHTLGQLANLNKDDLGRRLGPTAVHLWERANGKCVRLLKLVAPVESFAETFEFENEIETVEPLLFILRRFLEQISLRLAALYYVARELNLQITFSDKKSYEHCFKIPQPTRSVEVLFRMLHTHLENFKSDFPITAVSLEAQATKPSQQQFGLFETALRNPAQLSETLARLTGLLGAERVGTPVLEDTNRPDSFHLESFSWKLDESVSVEKTLPSHTLRRFRSPDSAQVFSAENQPAYLQSAQVNGEVYAAAGPYHSSGNWWAENAWARAEWDLQLGNGALCRCHRDDKQNWKVDGVYD